MQGFLEDTMTKRWAINSAVRFAPLFTEEALWVKNIITEISQPYIVAKSTSEAIKGLVANKASVAQLEPAVIRELEEIGVIFDESSVQNDKDSWSAQLEKTKTELRHQLWTIVRALYNPVGASAFRAWVDHSRRFYRDGDALVANRMNCHNDRLCRSFHVEFSKVLIPLFPELVKPSYCYLGIYHDQAELPKHTDREQCRWNVSVILDSSPEITNLNDSWPIYLEPAACEQVRLSAVIGDAIVYRGDKIPHWREPLPKQFNQVSICFFHYVHRSFSGSLD
jgi:hypothetical protein